MQGEACNTILKGVIPLPGPIRAEDIFSIKAPGGAQVSPDGTKIVYVVMRVDKEQDKSLTDLYLYNVELDIHHRLTSSGKDSAPRFSPDGKRLAFISSRREKSQIFILDLAGGEAWQLPTKESVVGVPLWLPDGQSIAYSARVYSKQDDWTPYPGALSKDGERLKTLAEKAHEDKKKEDDDKKANLVKVITRLSYRRDGEGYYGESRQQVFVTEVPAAAPFEELKPAGRQITGGDYDHFGPAISPCGKFLVVSARREHSADFEQKSDLWLFDVENCAGRLLYEGAGYTGSPLWSGSGDYISLTGDDGSYGSSTTTDLWILNVTDFMAQLKRGEEPATLTYAQARNITRPFDRPVGCYARSEIHYGGSSMFWEGDDFYFLMTDQGSSGIYKTNPSDITEAVIADEGRSISSLHGAQGLLVYTCSTPINPEELHIYSGSEERQITEVNSSMMSEVSPGEWEKFVYHSDDGQEVDGWLLYPPAYEEGKQYPMVLLVHGGPHGAYGPTFMLGAQILSGEGYLVLYTNPRGSETYGQEFAAIIDKNWGDRDYADVMAGVDAVIERGIVDTARIFAHGWSYGGYLTCWMVTQTNRFKAVCAGACVSNMLSGIGTSDITLADEWEYGGQTWSDAEHLMKHSPLSHVDKVETPFMLMHGEKDMRCPVSQSEEFYVALRRQGKEAIMIRYPDEYHGLRRPVHRVDRYERLVAWFNYYSQ